MKTFVTITIIRGKNFASVETGNTAEEILVGLQQQAIEEDKIRQFQVIEIENPENFLVWAKIKIKD